MTPHKGWGWNVQLAAVLLQEVQALVGDYLGRLKVPGTKGLGFEYSPARGWGCAMLPGTLDPISRCACEGSGHTPYHIRPPFARFCYACELLWLRVAQRPCWRTCRGSGTTLAASRYINESFWGLVTSQRRAGLCHAAWVVSWLGRGCGTQHGYRH